MKKLVTYFSCTGFTKKFAEEIANKLNCDIKEIKPSVAYTEEDLDWTVKDSRSTIEMKDLSSRPSILKELDNLDEYDTIYVGYPIWWGKAPTIINTFLEMYDLTGKTIIPFATYHSSGIGESDKYLEPSCKGAIYKEATGFQMNDIKAIDKWLKENK